MTTRRRTLAAIGGSAAIGSSGCLRLLTGERTVEVAAKPARGSTAAARETGYELDDLNDESVSEVFEVAGETRKVEASNWVATHEKTVDHPAIGPADMGVFAVVSTPSVEVAGQEINPVGGYDNDALVDLLADEYDELAVDDEAVESFSQDVLGEEVTVSVFEGDARFDDQSLDVFVHVGSLLHEDDYVVSMGIYPQALPEEREKIETMTASIQHPVEP